MSTEISEEKSLLPVNPSIVDKTLIYISTAILATIVLLIISQVLIRVLSIQTSAFWLTPLSQVLLVVGTFLGSIVATGSDQHIKLEFARAKISGISPTTGKAVDIGSRIAVVITLLVMLISAAEATVSGWNTVFESISLIKSGYIYLTISIGIVLMIIFELRKIVNTHQHGQ